MEKKFVFTRGVRQMDVKQAKRFLYDSINIVSEFWSDDEKENKMLNAMGYYNNFEEDMAQRNMTPQEYLEYACNEIAYLK